MMFGPTDTNSPNTSLAMKWRIKRESNDNLREKFINKTIPQAELIGLKIPDANIQLLEDGSYSHGSINWDEFWDVVNGNGPCNQQRLEHHIKAHNDGAWVREAAYFAGINQK
jgi:ring-1,2-phenylacetyl-CoA epoxidase subunit PaaA